MAGLILTSIRVKHVLDALPRPLSGLCYPCESLDPEVRIPGNFPQIAVGILKIS